MTVRHARITVRSPSALRLEQAAAEAFEAGALGVEEGEGEVWIYLRAEDAVRVAAALAGVPGLRLAPPEPVPERAWAEAWKEGLEAIVVSERLLVRPSFRSAPAGFRGCELVIDPGQAFGTGGHASTRLALEWIAELPAGALRAAQVLDVGCGSGVLALAALALGAERAVGCDLDPLATRAARDAARANRASERLALFTGSLDALAPATRFDLVVANLLRRELEPWLGALAARLRPGGRIVLSGLLESEGPAVERALRGRGIGSLLRRTQPDPGGEPWLALLGEGPTG